MATAICGAFKGIDYIKEEYIESLNKANDVDFNQLYFYFNEWKEMSLVKTLVLGAAVVDIIMKIPRLPKSDEDIFMY